VCRRGEVVDEAGQHETVVHGRGDISCVVPQRTLVDCHQPGGDVALVRRRLKNVRKAGYCEICSVQYDDLKTVSS